MTLSRFLDNTVAIIAALVEYKLANACTLRRIEVMVYMVTLLA